MLFIRGIFTWIGVLLVAMLVSLVFWIAWTVCGTGATFAAFLPPVYLAPSFLQCLGIFVSIACLKSLVPTIVDVTQTNTNNRS